MNSILYFRIKVIFLICSIMFDLLEETQEIEQLNLYLVSLKDNLIRIKENHSIIWFSVLKMYFLFFSFLFFILFCFYRKHNELKFKCTSLPNRTINRIATRRDFAAVKKMKWGAKSRIWLQEMQQRILGIVIETMTKIDAHLLRCYF